MNVNKDDLKQKTLSISTSISSFLIPIFQYVPCTAVWFGIMSVPIIIYVVLFFQNPAIVTSDIIFLFNNYGTYIALSGLLIFLYAFTYYLSHRKQLLTKGIYKYTRNPQYLGFIILTLGLTLVVFETSPIINLRIPDLNHEVIMISIWIAQVIAYIILAKIEEYALKATYGSGYTEYKNKTAFLVPFVKFKKR